MCFLMTKGTTQLTVSWVKKNYFALFSKLSHSIVDYDLQYNHSSDDYTHHYGGIYYIASYENQTCFHFHTKDDDVFEGNEDFSIKLFSFTPTKYNGSDINNGTIDFFDIFNHVNVTDYHDYENENYYDYHDHDYYSFESINYSEHLYSDTIIPDSLSTIHVTIVDNEGRITEWKHALSGVVFCL